MLSYRHAFHAGNHADVLKHLVLVHCLEYMNTKDKPYLVVDTHAGAGLYSLDADHAKRTGEYLHGVARLWDLKTIPPSLTRYMALLRQLNSGKLRRYPGSPWITEHMLRESDRLRLAELHSTDFAFLRRHYRDAGRRITVEQEDGFAVLKAALPPVSRRGLVLIDPSYEIKSDYMKVSVAVKEALKRFATGTYLIWHPMLPSIDANQLPEKLKKSGATHWLHATLRVRPPATKGHGMHGSGVFVINPPWTLQAQLEEALTFLTPLLAATPGAEGEATWSVEAFELGATPTPARQHRPPGGLASQRITSTNS